MPMLASILKLKLKIFKILWKPFSKLFNLIIKDKVKNLWPLKGWLQKQSLKRNLNFLNKWWKRLLQKQQKHMKIILKPKLYQKPLFYLLLYEL